MTAINPYTGIHHAAFATRDILLTTRYWRDLLGMPLVYCYGQPGYRQYFFHIQGEGHLSFFEWSEVTNIPLKRHGQPVAGPFGFDHVSIGVDRLEVLWELMAKLDGAGFPVSDVIDHGCFYSIYSYDPNGIAVEFTWNVPDLNLRINPVIQDEFARSMCGLDQTMMDPWPDPIPILPEERIVLDGEGKENFANLPPRPDFFQTPESQEP
ncbi:MAG: VOC family protein [Magnetococcales bacterium]|nr:VOC family protein [Magnetococcales bacterium]